ncbi:MAG: hypothetical protein IJF75_01365 [Clostridia bacterium]|nr:hypothetical protein [Clostridia bacterium]
MKKLTKTLFALMLACVALFTVSACTSEKIFEVEGLMVCLDTTFEVVEGPNTVNIVSDHVQFVAIKEVYDILSEEVNQFAGSSEYADAIIAQNGYKAVPKVVNGTAHFEFDDDNYYNYFVILRSTDAFWTCQFRCSLSEKDKYASKISEWAAMIIA